MNARNRSTKSLFIGQIPSQPPELLAQLPHTKDAFGFRNLHPELEIVPIGLGCRRIPAHGEAGRAVVEASHSWDQVAEKSLVVYERALQH